MKTEKSSKTQNLIMSYLCPLLPEGQISSLATVGSKQPGMSWSKQLSTLPLPASATWLLAISPANKQPELIPHFVFPYSLFHPLPAPSPSSTTCWLPPHPWTPPLQSVSQWVILPKIIIKHL
jgi:hypothetical protein